jgi:hypothetical protein
MARGDLAQRLQWALQDGEASEFTIEVSQPAYTQETPDGVWVQAWVLVPHGYFDEEDDE